MSDKVSQIHLVKNPAKKVSKTKLYAKKIATNLRDSKRFFSIHYWRNNLSQLFAFILFFLAHVALITSVFIVQAGKSVAVYFARVPGMLLNFICALTYLLVLKRLITWVRISHIGRRIAVLDGLLDFHKLLGFYILFLSLVHSFGHFFNFCKDLSNLFWFKKLNKLTFKFKGYLSSDYSSSHFDPATNKTIQNTVGTYAELLFTTKSGVGWVYGTASPTGK